jgi:hypothetical protein
MVPGALAALALLVAALLNGLALARQLPEAHARALAIAALCLTEDGAPADHGADHAGGCVACPAPAIGAAKSAPPPAIAAVAPAPHGSAIVVRFVAAVSAPPPQRPLSQAQPRGPPTV